MAPWALEAAPRLAISGGIAMPGPGTLEERRDKRRCGSLSAVGFGLTMQKTGARMTGKLCKKSRRTALTQRDENRVEAWCGLVGRGGCQKKVDKRPMKGAGRAMSSLMGVGKAGERRASQSTFCTGRYGLPRRITAVVWQESILEHGGRKAVGQAWPRCGPTCRFALLCF